MLSSRPPNNLFLYYRLILSKIDSKWFCLWGEEGGKKMKFAIWGKEKKKITAAHFSRYHGNGTFKILSLMRTAGRERLITRETICYSFGESLGDWLHTLFFSLSLSHTGTHTHTRTQRDRFFMWTAVKNHLFSALSRPFSRRTMGVRL